MQILKYQREIATAEAMSGLYAALFSKAPLAEPFQHLFGQFGAENFTLRYRSGDRWVSIAHNLPVQNQTSIDDLVINDPWAERMDILPPDRFHIDEEILPHAKFIKTPYYHELIRPNKINHHSMVSIFTIEHRKYRLSVFRPRARRNNAFQDLDRATWNHLLPSLRHILSLGQRHLVLEQQSSSKLVPALPLWNAELRVLAALASGMSLRDYAAKSQISLHTARWYVKSALKKTGLHDRVKLINMLGDHFSDRFWYRNFLQ